MVQSQSPQTGQFNSYNGDWAINCMRIHKESQSPQTGQFNSYDVLVKNGWIPAKSLNPLKRVNSILTDLLSFALSLRINSLNPLKRVNSILTKLDGWIEFVDGEGLNPLKRVNSILTEIISQSVKGNLLNVSIPSNGSIQFLQEAMFS